MKEVIKNAIKLNYKSQNLNNEIELYCIQRWLRETHSIHVYVNHYKFGVKSCDGFYYHIGKSVRDANTYYTGKSNSYDKCLELGLLEVLSTLDTK